MKKEITMAIMVSVAGFVSADIAVDLQNSGGVFTTDGATFVDQAYVQLVWNETAPVAAPGAVGLSLLAPGDTILSDFTTTIGFAGTWSDLGNQGGEYDFVGVNTGYLTVRVFDAADLGVGAKFLQFDIDVDGSLTDYVSTDTGTIYQTDGTLGGDIGASAYQVIPEPGTIGLMGVAGLGMFLARRKARR